MGGLFNCFGLQFVSGNGSAGAPQAITLLYPGTLLLSGETMLKTSTQIFKVPTEEILDLLLICGPAILRESLKQQVHPQQRQRRKLEPLRQPTQLNPEPL